MKKAYHMISLIVNKIKNLMKIKHNMLVGNQMKTYSL